MNIDNKKLLEWINEHEIYEDRTIVYAEDLKAAITNNEFEPDECEHCEQELEDSKVSAWFVENVKHCRFCGRPLKGGERNE